MGGMDRWMDDSYNLLMLRNEMFSFVPSLLAMFPAISRVLTSEHSSRRLWQWGLQVNIVHVTVRCVAQDFLVTNMLSCISDRGGQLKYLIIFILSLTVIQRIISFRRESHEMNYVIILVLHTRRRHINIQTVYFMWTYFIFHLFLKQDIMVLFYLYCVPTFLLDSLACFSMHSCIPSVFVDNMT